MSAVNKWVRIIHRWVSFLFIPTIITALVLLIASGENFQLPNWINFPALGSLVLLLISGAYLFLLHYISKIKRARRVKKVVAVSPVVIE